MAVQIVPLLDQTFSLSNTTFFPSTAFKTAGCNAVRVLYIVLASGGTSPNFKADIGEVLADGTLVDYFNDGNHSASFTANIGTGLSNNILPPANMYLNLHANAADNTFTIRAIATGYIYG